MKHKYTLLIIFILSLYNCDNPSTPKFQTEISVFAILHPDWKHQEIYVYRTYENIADSVSKEDLFEKDARVTVSGYNQQIEFTYFYDADLRQSRYIDSTEHLNVMPGSQYKLIVETEFGTLEGKTVVPNPIRILAPEQGDSIKDRADVDIRLNAVENAEGYIINLLSPPEKIWMNYNFRSTRCFNSTDTIFVIPGEYIRYEDFSRFGEFIEENRRYTLKVMALDKNFKHHLFDGYDISGVTNGYGVFGSAVVDSLDFFVIK
ncbi:MAG: DUF4249 family protein [Candidatus Marinimicrobia bacterium]|nr:DUF4249 family protein [Candidatus Neomarinimicrobiota bacterium]